MKLSNNTGNETVNNTGNETAENTLPLSNQCLTGHSNLAMHIHPWLNLTISETNIPIPENMGIDTFACPNAMHLLHTHDDTGKLHIETYEPISLNLSLFFAVWNISQPGDSTFDILFLDPDNVTIIIDGVEQIVGIDEIIFEDDVLTLWNQFCMLYSPRYRWRWYIRWLGSLYMLDPLNSSDAA